MKIKLFFDENFSKPATDALAGLLAFRESETIVDHYQNRWHQGKRKDQEWIPDLAKEGGWIVVASDLGRSGGPKWRAEAATSLRRFRRHTLVDVSHCPSDANI